jgi:hypothetical protein
MRPAPSRSKTSDKPLTGPPPRPENVPPRGPSQSHRPSRSQEEALRARKPGASGSRPRPAAELDIFADPSDARKGDSHRRPRRNSDSSTMDRSSRHLDPEDERRRQERKRRERRQREREREGKDKDGKSKKPDRKLDIIDKLDVTSIYGTGRKLAS